MNNFFKTILFFGLLLSLFIAKPLLAANLFFETPKKNLALEEEFLVSVFLDAEGESLNALEGKILLANNQVELKEILSGNSAVSLWVEEPQLSSDNTLIFSGIIPGGFSDSKIFLFDFILKTKKAGSSSITVSDLRVLKNDGLGTDLLAKSNSLNFSVSEKIATEQKITQVVDTELPEDFIPVIERDKNIFDNQYFLVFATQDKISGVDNYQVREGSWGSYKVVKSPYLLKYQKLDKQIFIKVTDKAGNSRVVVLEAKNKSSWYNNIIILVTLAISIIIFILVLVKKVWKKSTK